MKWRTCTAFDATLPMLGTDDLVLLTDQHLYSASAEVMAAKRIQLFEKNGNGAIMDLACDCTGCHGMCRAQKELA